MANEQLKSLGYEVAPSKSKPGKFRWWLNTGSDGETMPPRDCSEVAYATEEAAWAGAEADAVAAGTLEN